MNDKKSGQLRIVYHRKNWHTFSRFYLDRVLFAPLNNTFGADSFLFVFKNELEEVTLRIPDDLNSLEDCVDCLVNPLFSRMFVHHHDFSVRSYFVEFVNLVLMDLMKDEKVQEWINELPDTPTDTSEGVIEYEDTILIDDEEQEICYIVDDTSIQFRNRNYEDQYLQPVVSSRCCDCIITADYIARDTNTLTTVNRSIILDNNTIYLDRFAPEINGELELADVKEVILKQYTNNGTRWIKPERIPLQD